MSISDCPETCWECESLRDDISKLRSMIRAIEQVDTHFGLAGDFDTELWINKSDINKIINDPEYK